MAFATLTKQVSTLSDQLQQVRLTCPTAAHDHCYCYGMAVMVAARANHLLVGSSLDAQVQANMEARAALVESSVATLHEQAAGAKTDDSTLRERLDAAEQVACAGARGGWVGV